MLRTHAIRVWKLLLSLSFLLLALNACGGGEEETQQKASNVVVVPLSQHGEALSQDALEKELERYDAQLVRSERMAGTTTLWLQPKQGTTIDNWVNRLMQAAWIDGPISVGQAPSLLLASGVPSSLTPIAKTASAANSARSADEIPAQISFGVNGGHVCYVNSTTLQYGFYGGLASGASPQSAVDLCNAYFLQHGWANFRVTLGSQVTSKTANDVAYDYTVPLEYFSGSVWGLSGTGRIFVIPYAPGSTSANLIPPCPSDYALETRVNGEATSYVCVKGNDNSTAQPVALPIASGCRAGESTANPIIPASGEKVFRQADIVDQAPHPLTLERTYRTQWQIAPQALMGTQWGHNHSANLRQDPADSSGNTLVLQLPDGSQRLFRRSSSTAAWTNASHADQLTAATTPAGAPAWRFTQTADDSQWLFTQPSASAVGKLQTHRQRNGWIYTYTYNTAGQLAQVRNRFNRSLSLTYHPSGLLATATGSNGQITSYTWDTSARLTRVTHPGGSFLTYHHENASFPQHITGITDESGKRYQTVAYDNLGRATVSALAGDAERYTVAYPGTAGGIQTAATITDPIGTARSFGYRQINGHTEVTSGSNLPGCKGEPPIASRTQSAQGLLESETDFLGNVTRYTWDIQRQLIQTITRAAGRPEQQVTTFVWHPTFALPLQITEPLQTTLNEYDSLGRLIRTTVTHTGGATPGKVQTTQLSYTTSGLLASRTEPNGAVTTYASHTAAGLPRTITNPLGHVTTVAYDTAGRPTRITQADGLVRTLTYSPRGWLLSSGETAGGVTLTTRFTHTPSGQVLTITRPSGHVITYQYDDAQRVVGWNDNRGQSASHTLDGLGNITAEQTKNSGGAVALQVSRSINALNRLDSQTLGLNQTSTYSYDANGRLQSILDAANASTQFTLDALARTSHITNALGSVAQLGYGAQDALTGASDFKGTATAYGRDAQGLSTSQTTPDAGASTTTVDSLNLPTRVVDALGRATDITRDALGRPTLITHSPAGGTPSNTPGSKTLTTELRYDLAGDACNAPNQPLAGRGRLCEMVDKVDGVLHATTQYQWDAFGRLTRQTQTLSSAIANHSEVQSTAYTYRASGGGRGELFTLAYPSGSVLTHQYNAAGRLTGMLWNGQPLLQSIVFNALGQPLSWRWAFADASTTTSLNATRVYNTAGQLTSSEFATFAPDANGRIAALSQSQLRTNASGAWVSESVPFSASYNLLGQLTGLQAQGASPALQWTHTYAWDANGNRTAGSISQGGITQQVTHTVDAASNRLTQAAGSPVTTNAAGEITSLLGKTLAYDAAGRMSQATQGTVTTTSRFNGVNQRFLRDTPSAQTVFSYGTEGFNLLSETTRNLGTSALSTTEHIWLPTANGPMPVAVVINGVHYAVHADHLNTPRRLTDASKAVKWQWAYSGFGEIAPQSTPATGQTPISYALRYPGQVDDGNGLFYNWHRFYHPATGRYTKADPIGLDGGWNRFAYVNGNPLNGSDPSGLIDSLNARVLALAAQGDLQGAIFLAQTVGGSAGAMTLATRLQQFQTSVQALTTRYPLATNRCVDVAEGIAEAAKTANLTPQFLRIAPSQTPFVYIGDRYTAVQHFAVRFGDRVFDSYTGAQGMLYGQYINMLNGSNLGSGSYVIQNIQTLAPYK